MRRRKTNKKAPKKTRIRHQTAPRLFHFALVTRANKRQPTQFVSTNLLEPEAVHRMLVTKFGGYIEFKIVAQWRTTVTLVTDEYFELKSQMRNISRAYHPDDFPEFGNPDLGSVLVAVATGDLRLVADEM